MTEWREILELPGVNIDAGIVEERNIELHGHLAGESALCPGCGQRSEAVHSHYQRTLRDLPLGVRSAQLVAAVRRFRCRNQACSKTTFTESLQALAPAYARRTSRLTRTLGGVGMTVGAEAGSRLARHLRMKTSPDTMLRIMRRTPLPVRPTPRVLGVDDWALRRGQKYGTILVDLERHQSVDLLLDRTAETLAAWLRAHPGVEVISRDRSPEYSRGASEGAPQAHQVADRWHLLKNLREALERLLSRLRAELEHLPLPANAPPPVAGPRPALDSQKPSRQVALQANRERRYARYQAVRTLLEQGVPQLQIARRLGMARRTVRTFARTETFPERAMPPPTRSILDPYLPCLRQRLAEGCSNSGQLGRELQTQGYGGSRAQVASWVQYYRTSPSPSTPHRYLADPSREQLTAPTPPALLPAPRQLVWYLLRPTDDLTHEEKLIFSRIRRHPQVDGAYRLSRQFQRMIRDHSADNLSAWLQACLDSTIPDLQTFAASLQREEPSIRLALSTSWSTGPVEGFVNRLKLIKRSRYGRANFDLLRLRVLAPAL